MKYASWPSHDKLAMNRNQLGNEEVAENDTSSIMDVHARLTSRKTRRTFGYTKCDVVRSSMSHLMLIYRIR
jgi:hypothetical protein